VVEKKEDRKSEPKEPNKPCPTEQENKKEKIELSDSDIIISINLR
jgi:hypothetical protein